MRAGTQRLLAIVMRAFDALLISLVALFVGIFFYGLVCYPDAPIRQCNADQFCGKSNKLHSEEDFRGFVAWEKTLVYSLGFAVLAGGILIKRREARVSSDLKSLLAAQQGMPAAVEERRYAAAWRDLRRREISVPVVFILALLSIGWVSIATDGGPVALSFEIGMVVLAVGCNLWLLLFRCPRCRSIFFTRQSTERCHHCRLRRGATFAEAMAELNSSI
jgi:hypothetical protein